MVFPCSRILYLCFESLGLDITSVIFNVFYFKKWQQHTPFWFLFIKESYEQLIPTGYTFGRKSFPNSNKFSPCFWISKLLESDPFDFYIENLLTKFFPTYWLVLTLDPCPWERNKYFILELHPVLVPLPPQKNLRILIEQKKKCRAKSPFI